MPSKKTKLDLKPGVWVKLRCKKIVGPLTPGPKINSSVHWVVREGGPDSAVRYIHNHNACAWSPTGSFWSDGETHPMDIMAVVPKPRSKKPKPAAKPVAPIKAWAVVDPGGGMQALCLSRAAARRTCGVAGRLVRVRVEAI